MKNKTLLVIGLATALVAMTGCKTKERFSALPGGAGGSVAGLGKGATDLSTSPFAGNGATTEGATGSNFNDPSLPSEDGLDGRDLDRTEFANQTVYFDYDQSNVKASEAGKVNEVLASLKAKGTGYDLLIEGHCDERGTEEYNRALGERRALAIRELLMQSGVSGTRVFTRTFGKDKPVVPSHDEAAFSKNRRGEFVLVLPKKLTTTQLTK